jgi:hypothetical protein
VEKNAHAYDRYERRDDFVIHRTYGSESEARSTWTMHAVDANHATLNIDASVTMPWWRGMVMKPVPEEDLPRHQLHALHPGSRAPGRLGGRVSVAE